MTKLNHLKEYNAKDTNDLYNYYEIELRIINNIITSFAVTCIRVIKKQLLIIKNTKAIRLYLYPTREYYLNF